MLGQSSKNTSKKAKKSSDSKEDKPKQPQRGLGVAQLEQIRMEMEFCSQFSQDASAPYDYLPPQQSPAQIYPTNTTIGFGVTNRANINQLRWNSSHQVHRWNFHHYAQGGTSTRPVEDFMRPQNNYIDFMGPSSSSSQNSDPTATSGELDLELRLCSTPPEPSVE